MGIRKLLFAALVSGVVFGGCTCNDKKASDAEAGTTSANAEGPGYDASHLDDEAKRALAEIVNLETTKDVTCWTSFRQLDSFISSKEYSNFAAISKITATKALTRAAWEKASKAATGDKITAADLKALKLPEAQTKDKEKLAQFATDTLKMKAYTDYRTTSEHWRVLLSVMQDEMLAGPKTPLKPLAPDAITELADVATKLSLVLLQKSGELAQTDRTPFIEAVHVKKAHDEIAQSADLKNSPRETKPADEAMKKRMEPLTKTLIEGKVKALLTYNKSTGTLLGDMNRVAKVPLAEDGLDAYRKQLQSFVHFVAAGHEPMQADNFLSDGQFAPAKLPTKYYIDAPFAATSTLQLFPHLIMPNGDLLLHFDPNPAWAGPKDRKAFDVTIRDYEQNAIRDTAVPWLVLEQVYKERAYAMDPFAAEYTSEVVSMMATYYLRRAEALAKAAKATEIHKDIVGEIRDRQWVQTMPHAPNTIVWTPEQEAKKKTALAKYTQLYKDVTVASGILASMKANKPLVTGGTAGPDLSHAGGGKDLSHAGGGKDLSHAGGGKDLSHAGGGKDLSHAGGGKDLSHAGGGGDGGRDLSHAGGGKDLSHAGGGKDLSHAGGGKDLSHAGGGGDGGSLSHAGGNLSHAGGDAGSLSHASGGNAHGVQRIMGSGVAVGDVNKDGYPDLFIAEEGAVHLFLNKGKEAPGKFTDANQAWGIPDGIEDAKHVLFFDSGGSGDLDLLIVRSDHPSMILKNEKGKFTDATEALGFKTHKFGAHVATVFDYDGDGDLDIYIGYYGSDASNRQGSEAPNLPSMDGKNGTPHQLWKRMTDGKYTEVGQAAGVADTGWTLAVGAFDYDNDGKLDMFLANDFGPDVLYHNKGDGTFEDVSKLTRTDDNGSGMNASFADVNGDGFLDFYVSNIDMFSKNIKVVYPTEKTTLTSLDEQLATTFQYLSGNKMYVNPADPKGKTPFKAEEGKIFEPGDRGWGWASLFFDYENDGDDDMYLSNGWIDGSTAANQKKQMFINDAGFFYLAPPSSPEAVPSNGRAAINFDMDRDGDEDLLLINFRQAPVLLENTQNMGNHWIQLRLRGNAPNTYAIGTRVTVTAGPKKILREVTCGNGYLGQDEDIVALGIGSATDATVNVRWPNGKVQSLPGVQADKITEIHQ